MQSAKDAPSAVSDWTKKKGETVELIKLLQAYKDLGDSKGEVQANMYSASNRIAFRFVKEKHETIIVDFAGLPQIPQPEDVRGP